MSKRILLIILPSAVLLIVLLYFLFFKPQSSLENLNAFKAVPTSTPVVIKINDPLHFLELNTKNELISSIVKLDREFSLQNTFDELNQLTTNHEQFKKLLKQNELIVSLR